MNHLDDQLTGAFEQMAADAPHDADLASSVRRRVRRRRQSAGAVFAVVGLTVGGLGWAFETQRPGPAIVRPVVQPAASVPVQPSRLPSEAPDVCDNGGVRSGVLPEWARTGFSDPEPVMPFITSESGSGVAILFGDVLTSPAREDIANKVLWVWRDLPADRSTVRVDAQQVPTRKNPGVRTLKWLGPKTYDGPSYFDAPLAACWRITLTWPGGGDSILMPVVRPQDAPRRTATP